jgi:hypothetical protein
MDYYSKYLKYKKKYINLVNEVNQLGNGNFVTPPRNERTMNQDLRRVVPNAPVRVNRRLFVNQNELGIPHLLFPETGNIEQNNNLMLPDLVSNNISDNDFDNVPEIRLDCDSYDLLTLEQLVNGDIILVCLTGGTIDEPLLDNRDLNKSHSIIFRNRQNKLTPEIRENYINYYSHLRIDQYRNIITGFRLYKFRC